MILKINVLKQFSSIRHKIHKKVQLSDLELREGGGRAFFGCPAGFFVPSAIFDPKEGGKGPLHPCVITKVSVDILC